jgi:predicted dinucleotide-binding enzyme
VRFGVLGTGVVGQTLGTALVGLGHEVCLGSRTSPNERAQTWVDSSGDAASAGTFAQAAAFGEIVLNCTAGQHSLSVIDQAGAEALAGKVVVDVANALDFSDGFPPRLAVGPTDSLAEQIQRRLPRSHVVKALNTVTASVMVDPGSLAEHTDLFIAGDDDRAKTQVTDLLAELGWSRDRVRDLGALSAARATEGYLPLWLAILQSIGSPDFNVRLVTHGGST